MNLQPLAAAGAWSESEPDRRADESTAFEIGSITKVMTAWMAAQARQQIGLRAPAWGRHRQLTLDGALTEAVYINYLTPLVFFKKLCRN